MGFLFLEGTSKAGSRLRSEQQNRAHASDGTRAQLGHSLDRKKQSRIWVSHEKVPGCSLLKSVVNPVDLPPCFGIVSVSNCDFVFN
jgi:hypothetical protein